MRRLFFAVGLISFINLSILAGLIGYAGSQGWLERERILAAAAALQGETLQAKEVSDETGEEAAAIEDTSRRIARNTQLEDQYRAELARREREIRDQTKMLEVQQLALMKQREAFEDERERFNQEQNRLAEAGGDEGMKKVLEIIEGLKADDALPLLRQKQDAEVVWLLKSMDIRKARKIVSKCETQAERSWIGRILGQLHDQHAAQAEVLGADA